MRDLHCRYHSMPARPPARPRSLPRGDRDRLAGRMNAKSSSQQQSRCFELKSQLAVDTVNLTYYYYCNKKKDQCHANEGVLPSPTSDRSIRKEFGRGRSTVVL